MKADAPRSDPMRAGVAVDDWKLPVFRKRLRKAGFDFKEVGPLTDGTTLLTVETNNMLALKKVLERCQSECREMKR